MKKLMPHNRICSIASVCGIVADLDDSIRIVSPLSSPDQNLGGPYLLVSKSDPRCTISVLIDDFLRRLTMLGPAYVMQDGNTSKKYVDMGLYYVRKLLPTDNVSDIIHGSSVRYYYYTTVFKDISIEAHRHKSKKEKCIIICSGIPTKHPAAMYGRLELVDKYVISLLVDQLHVSGKKRYAKEVPFLHTFNNTLLREIADGSSNINGIYYCHPAEAKHILKSSQ